MFISVGLGMVVVVECEGKGWCIVCVIGDGVIMVGMVFEVMNYVGDIYLDMLVIFNDNEMFIFENVGGLNNYLVQLLFGKFYISLCEGGKKVFLGLLLIKDLLKCIEEYLKGMVVFSILFEELGFNYIGLVDGYDV